MCGIFGFAKQSGHQTDKQLDMLKEVLTELADESSIRGTDSTGMSIIQPNSRKTYKTLLDSSSLVDTGDWTELLDDITKDTTIAIGHVRLATHGVIKTRNAHPFHVGDVVGAHNGIIHNYNKVASSLGKEVEVDSQVIFASLNRHKMSKAFEDIDGDFAITWIKDSNSTIHLARESGRPMSVAYWKKARILFWASTDAILEMSMTKAGLRLPIENVKADFIHSYDTNKFTNKANEETEEFYTMSQWNRYTPSVYSYGGYEWKGSISSESAACELSPSPASKLIGEMPETDLCEACMEWLPIEEVEIVNGRSICIDCEYGDNTIPYYALTNKENKDDKFPL